MNELEIVIYGASGYSVAVGHALASRAAAPCRIAGFIDDFNNLANARLDGRPVFSFCEWQDRYKHLPCLVAVGDPAKRRSLAERVADAGGRFTPRYPAVEDYSAGSRMVGEGVYVDAFNYIGPLSTIGNHVHIMPMCSIGHDVAIGDFCTICPSTTLSGYVIIEEGVYIGAGTTIVNGRVGAPIRIGAGARIGAGSVVRKSIPAAAKVAGNPARPYRQLIQERGRRPH